MQGVVVVALSRWLELRVWCAASASCSSAEAASSVLSTSSKSWIARVGRANSSTRHLVVDADQEDSHFRGGGGLTPTRKLTSRVRTEVMAFEDGQWSGFYRSEQLLCCKSVCIQELFPCWSKHEWYELPYSCWHERQSCLIGAGFITCPPKRNGSVFVATFSFDRSGSWGLKLVRCAIRSAFVDRHCEFRMTVGTWRLLHWHNGKSGVLRIGDDCC